MKVRGTYWTYWTYWRILEKTCTGSSSKISDKKADTSKGILARMSGWISEKFCEVLSSEIAL